VPFPCFALTLLSAFFFKHLVTQMRSTFFYRAHLLLLCHYPSFCLSCCAPIFFSYTSAVRRKIMARQGKRSRVSAACYGVPLCGVCSYFLRLTLLLVFLHTCSAYPVVFTQLSSYFPSRLPCCALFFFAFNYLLSLFFFALTMLCPYFSSHLPCCALKFFVRT